MAETEKREVGEPSGRGSHIESEDDKSAGLKNVQGCVPDINLQEPDITNGGTVESAVKSNVKKRGRPKGSTVKAGGDMNGRMPKKPRGGEEDSLSTPRKRGRPKGSPKKLIRKIETSNGTGKRGRPRKIQAKGNRGRPKKMVKEGATQKEPAADGQPRKRPGRPKGSLKKTVLTVRYESTAGRPTRVIVAPEKLSMSLPGKRAGKRGRPKKLGRGRPRKRPLDQEDKLYQPRVWKALGRPRKYPKEDPSEGTSSRGTRGRGRGRSLGRGRGRPRKSESKKGAHLKKFNSDGTPNKPPKAAKEQDGTPRKRGRPKGSVKNKAILNNSSDENVQNSDQNMEVAPENDVSSSAPCEDNNLNEALVQDGI